MKIFSVEVFADDKSFEVLNETYDGQLLRHAQEKDFGVEWLSHKMSVKVVENMDEALAHIAKFSSKHSEAIVAEDADVVDRFLNEVDAACVYANASTAFSDGGEFGLGSRNWN